MNETLTAFLYLLASICFIMSLRGLSSPETSRGGLLYGVGGMVIAIAHHRRAADRAELLVDHHRHRRRRRWSAR